jgi:hypothetical protein
VRPPDAANATPTVDERHYCILGYHATVTTPDPDARATISAVLAGFTMVPTVPPGTPRYRVETDGTWWSLTINGEKTYESVFLSEALIALEWHLVTDLLAFRADRFHLHGAALRTPDGAASILILGASGSGKTTLTLALMARGFVPYADDIILIDPQMLAPATFRRAFHVDDATHALVAALPDAPTWDFDALPPGYFMPPQWAETPAPVRAIFFPTLRPEEEPSAAALSITDAVTTLLPFSTTLDQKPTLALPVAARLTAQATCYALTTGDLAATAALIRRIIATTTSD